MQRCALWANGGQRFDAARRPFNKQLLRDGRRCVVCLEGSVGGPPVPFYRLAAQYGSVARAVCVRDRVCMNVSSRPSGKFDFSCTFALICVCLCVMRVHVRNFMHV